jgi:hypothetical protein
MSVHEAGRRKSGSREDCEAYKSKPSLDSTTNGATVPQVVPQVARRIYDSKVMRMPWDDHHLDEEQSQGLCLPLSRVEPCTTPLASDNVLRPPSTPTRNGEGRWSELQPRRRVQDECVPLSPVGGMPATPVGAVRCTPPPNSAALPFGEKWLGVEDDSPSSSNGGGKHFY